MTAYLLKIQFGISLQRGREITRFALENFLAAVSQCASLNYGKLSAAYLAQIVRKL